MFGKASIGAVIVLGLLACQAQGALIESKWVGGGAYGVWHDAENWDPNIVPDNDGNNFAVIIDSSLLGGGEIEVGIWDGRTIDKLDCYGDVDLEAEAPGPIADDPPSWRGPGLVLEEIEGLTNYGELDISSVRAVKMDIRGNITNTTGAMIHLREAVVIYGNVYNKAGAALQVEGEVAVEDEFTAGGGNLENFGAIQVVPDSDLYVADDLDNLGTLLVYGGMCGCDEIFDNNSAGLVRAFGVLYGTEVVRNEGEIVAFGGSLVVASQGSMINTGVLRNDVLSSLQIKPSLMSEPAVDVNNNGTIEARPGGGVVFDCNLVNESDGVVRLLGGTLGAGDITQSAGATFEGFGKIGGDVLMEPNAIIKLTGPTDIVGDVEIPAGATLEISNGQTLIAGHTVCEGTIHLKGGTVVFGGGCDCEYCDIISEPGAERNHFDVDGDGTVNLKDFAYFADNWLWQASWYSL